MNLGTQNKVKEISISAIVRRVSKCKFKTEEHELGIEDCECYLEDLGKLSYWHDNPIKNIWVNLFKVRK